MRFFVKGVCETGLGLGRKLPSRLPNTTLLMPWRWRAQLQAIVDTISKKFNEVAATKKQVATVAA